jgi:hypothetical protein
MLKKSSFIIFLTTLLSRSASACSVCFSGADGNLRRGFTWGVLFLGLLPFVMLGAFIVMVVRSSRRQRSL